MLVVDPATAATHRRYPSISLLVPIAGPTPWPARLTRLRRQAEHRLRAEFGTRVDRTLLDRLQHAVETAKAPAGAHSVAVYVNDTTSTTVGIPVTVRERAVIDDTFATRDLLAGDLRTPRYWVLALNLDDPRLLHGHGSALHHVPLPLRDTIEHPSRRGDRGRDRTDIVEARRTRRLRAIDQSLGETLAATPDPVVVVGPEPTLSRFLDRTRHIARIEAVIRRDPGRDLTALAATIAPSLTDMLAERRVLALDALESGVGARTAVSGLQPVWRAVHRTPGLLLVEHTYEQPVRLLPGNRVSPAEDATAPEVIDDGIDDIIEAVLARGGRVEILPDGALVPHQRIAFVPAYRRRR